MAGQGGSNPGPLVGGEASTFASWVPPAPRTREPDGVSTTSPVPWVPWVRPTTTEAPPGVDPALLELAGGLGGAALLLLILIFLALMRSEYL